MECAMTSEARAERAAAAAPVFLRQGFRPFFLAACIWAAVALALWIVLFVGGVSLPSRFSPLAWHIHEMLFGFVMAAIAGFLLTAVPNWTGRLPVRGLPLAALAALWLVGRTACLFSAFFPDWLVLVADLSFPVALIAVITREIVTGRNWRTLPMIVPVAVLGIPNLLMHLETFGVALPAGLGWRLGIASVVILISVVAGRIVPSFTRNWMAKRGFDLPAPHGLVDRIALGVLHTGLLAWVFLPAADAVGLILVAGGALNLWRLLRWRGGRAVDELLLLVLHVGYAWLVAGVVLLGLSILVPSVPQSSAIHALTAGAMGTMILAVMTRAPRGHTGRELSADGVTALIYLLVTLAAMTRVAAAFAAQLYVPLLIFSAVCWIAAFGAFILSYGPMLVGTRDHA
jgi:uncharacterized protein involved in response to NO